MEPSLLEARPERSVQFEQLSYFVAARYEHSAEHPVFNRTIGLRDTWSNAGKQGL